MYGVHTLRTMIYLCSFNYIEYAIMKPTPFTQKHIALGAKLAEFAGYNMPISYAGINQEHAAVRSSVGVFDVSHMGEFILKGPHALELIQRVTTNDASKLVSGKAQYSCLPNATGGIVDDLLVYCLEANNSYMLVVNASNITKDWDWIQQHNTHNVPMHNISDRTALLAIQGPNATKVVQALTQLDVLNMKYYTFERGVVAGIPNVIVSATGYTGAGGVEMYFEHEHDNANILWDAIMEQGKAYNIQPIGLGARDTLRLEMGYCLYGHDIDDTTSPLEAGLGWITKFSKDFINKAYFEQQKIDGVSKKLVGFTLLDKGIPRQGYTVTNAQGIAIGKVTSGTQAPSLAKAIGMAYVHKDYAALDTPIYVTIRDKQVQGVVCKVPFE